MSIRRSRYNESNVNILLGRITAKDAEINSLNEYIRKSDADKAELQAEIAALKNELSAATSVAGGSGGQNNVVKILNQTRGQLNQLMIDIKLVKYELAQKTEELQRKSIELDEYKNKLDTIDSIGDTNIGLMFMHVKIPDEFGYENGDEIRPKGVLEKMFKSRMSQKGHKYTSTFDTMVPLHYNKFLSQNKPWLLRTYTWPEFGVLSVDTFLWLLFEYDMWSQFIELIYKYIAMIETNQKTNVFSGSITLLKTDYETYYTGFIDESELRSVSYIPNREFAIAARNRSNGCVIVLDRAIHPSGLFKKETESRPERPSLRDSVDIIRDLLSDRPQISHTEHMEEQKNKRRRL